MSLKEIFFFTSGFIFFITVTDSKLGQNKCYGELLTFIWRPSISKLCYVCLGVQAVQYEMNNHVEDADVEAHVMNSPNLQE